jgi:hypothetical protein
LNISTLYIDKENAMKKLIVPIILLSLLLSACNLRFGTGPTQTQESPDAVYTHAAETMSSELTRVAGQATSTTELPAVPTNTNTTAPTNTTAYTPTKTPIPCLLVGYSDATIDVTVPDFTIMSPGQLFTKTWRLTNIGTCTWNSSYQLVFDHGDGMGATSTYAQTLTSGTVAPGQTVDVSVNLTAPATSGTYTGYWRFRDPNGVYFGINGSSPWVVKITVVHSVSVTLSPVVGESGTIRSDGGPWADYTVGESNADITKTTEAFLSFDISSIPAGSTITEVKLNLTAYTTMGNPFDLGVLNAYVTNIGPALDSADFVTGMPSGNIADWGSLIALNTIEASPELKTALQAKVGTSRLQIRFQYAGSNLNAVKDRLTFTSPTLIVTYTTP